tara:strand:- start:182 stop:424 length:243 start_codon:yes stop_codon:yes gene_type:complete
MPRQTSTVNVEISSYTRGGQFESGSFRTLGDVLREYSVDQGEAIIEVTGDDGEERKVTAAGLLQEGDTIVIMKSKNKSGQ